MLKFNLDSFYLFTFETLQMLFFHTIKSYKCHIYGLVSVVFIWWDACSLLLPKIWPPICINWLLGGQGGWVRGGGVWMGMVEGRGDFGPRARGERERGDVELSGFTIRRRKFLYTVPIEKDGAPLK